MSTVQNGQIVTNGLVLCLDAANSRSYVSGNTAWRDLTANNYSASLINGPAYSSTNLGNIQFDGTNQYLEVVNASSGSNNGAYTFGGWFKGYETSYIFSRGRDGAGVGWSAGIIYNSTTNDIKASVVTTSPSTLETSTVGPLKIIQTDTWVHAYAVWIPGVSISCYVNGDLDSSASTSRTVLRSSTRGWNASIIRSDLIYQSVIATFAVYNRALTATEILQNYNATKARFGL